MAYNVFNIRVLLYMIVQLVHHVFTVNITIDNAGFETDVISHDNSYLFTSTTPSNWAVTSSSCNSISGRGMIRPKGGTSINDSIFDDDVPEGTQCGFIFIPSTEKSQEECGVYQTLTGNVVTSDIIYILKAYVANPATNTWSKESQDGVLKTINDGFPGYRVQLLADSTILAEDDDELSIEEGHWMRSTINVTILENDANIGKTLEIRIINKNVAVESPFREIYFDDVQLEAIEITTTPNPTMNPSNVPSKDPTKNPSQTPTKSPSQTPTKNPSPKPTANPTKYTSTQQPTYVPSSAPTNKPSLQPLTPLEVYFNPTSLPTYAPLIQSSHANTYKSTEEIRYEMDPKPTDWLGIILAVVSVWLCIAICIVMVLFMKTIYRRSRKRKRANTDVEPMVSMPKMKMRQASTGSATIATAEINQTPDFKRTPGASTLDLISPVLNTIPGVVTVATEMDETPEYNLTPDGNNAITAPHDMAKYDTAGQMNDRVVSDTYNSEGGDVMANNEEESGSFESDDLFGTYQKKNEGFHETQVENDS